MANRSQWEYLGCMRPSPHNKPKALRLLAGKSHVPTLAPSESNTPLVCLLPCIIVTETTHLIAIPVLEHHLTVRAEAVVVRDARSADLEKSHHVLL
jgi:hypothetical protein